MTTRDLHSLVGDKIDVLWSDWSTRHPHLARAIDRARLVETTVQRVRDDPEFIQAMRDAGLDEVKLNLAAGILERANRLIGEALPL